MNNFSLTEINEKISERSKFVSDLKKNMSNVVSGQSELINKLIIAILADGHILLEGLPGLAKTLMVKTLSNLIKTDFQRIQFTPDMLPADLLGTLVYNQKTGEFDIRKGPIFSNIILADEINRTPPKTQAAMLESMQERKVSIGGEDHNLPDPFFVLATQNPIEQEGTYPLPEAQLDRFMFMIKVEYPNEEEEFEIMKAYTGASVSKPEPALSGDEIIEIQNTIRTVQVSEHVMRYAEKLVRVTRPGADDALDICKKWLGWGAGPRAGLSLILAAKAHALLKGKNHVGCSDVAAVAPPIFRHRLIPNFAAQSEGLDSDAITAKIIEAIPQH